MVTFCSFYIKMIKLFNVPVSRLAAALKPVSPATPLINVAINETLTFTK